MSNPILEERTEAAVNSSENCLPIGARVAEFEVTGIVGEGGFGIVYLAFDHSLQRVVALKEYMPGVMAGRGADQSVVVRSKRHQEAFDTGLRSFINEARLLAQFDHPALIKIHRFWEQDNTGYMAMRYYEGQTLKRIVQDDPGFVNEAWLKVMLQSILEALEALYKVQILHRDISPENIMIQKNGEAVLLDFGAARQIISDMTQALTVILKPGYAPIEQYADDPSMLQGPWTDIYSLSAVMYVAITNRTPPSSVARMIQDPLEPLAKGDHPGYSEQFLRAIDQGMAVKPEHRPRTIADFRALLGLESSSESSARKAPAPADEAVPPRAAARKNTAPAAAKTVMVNDGVPRNAARPGAQTDAADRASLLDPATRPMPPAVTAAPAAATLASGTTQVVAGSEAGKKVASGAIGKTAGAPSGKRPLRTPVRAAILVAVIGLAGIVTWQVTHRSPASVAVAAVPAGGTAGEQVVDEETLAWETLRQRTDLDADQVSRFIAQYPNGRMIDQARQRLDDLRRAKPAEPAAAVPVVAAAGTGAVATPADLKSATAAAASATPTAAVAGAAPAADAAAVPAEPAMVSVTLSIKPWGNVTIDGVDRGVSPPLKKLNLAEGKHAVRVLNPGFPEHVSEIEIVKKKSTRISVDFTPTGK